MKNKSFIDDTDSERALESEELKTVTTRNADLEDSISHAKGR